MLSVTGNADITTSTVGGAVTLGDTATSADTASAIVKRDGTGNFAAGSITLNTSLYLPATTATAGIIYSGAGTLIQAWGTQNFFAGFNAGNLTMTGTANLGVGWQALISDTSGGQNTAVGVAALEFDTSGGQNTAVGNGVMEFNSSGGQNTAIGTQALRNNTNSQNTANGYEALYSSTTGSNNIALGYLAGYNITTGSSNIDIGNQGLATDTNIIRIGTGQSQTFIAGVINGNGGGLTALNASQLTSIGNTNGGILNFFAGPAGNSTMSGSGNTAYGVDALYYNTNGYGNTACGAVTLQFNTNGNYNTANGDGALEYSTSGSANTAIGDGAIQSNGSGSTNTAVGYAALGLNTTGSGNIALGSLAGISNSPNASFNIDIGSAGFSTDNNIIRIGTSQTACYLAGTVYANGVALTSDRNAKENFTAVNAREMLAKVASLPVTEWNYKTDSKGVQHIGPMAQDFQAAFELKARMTNTFPWWMKAAWRWPPFKG